MPHLIQGFIARIVAQNRGFVKVPYNPIDDRVEGDIFTRSLFDDLRDNINHFAEIFDVIPVGGVAKGGPAQGYDHFDLRGLITSAGDVITDIDLSPGYLLFYLGNWTIVPATQYERAKRIERRFMSWYRG